MDRYLHIHQVPIHRKHFSPIVAKEVLVRLKGLGDLIICCHPMLENFLCQHIYIIIYPLISLFICLPIKLSLPAGLDKYNSSGRPFFAREFVLSCLDKK